VVLLVVAAFLTLARVGREVLSRWGVRNDDGEPQGLVQRASRIAVTALRSIRFIVASRTAGLVAVATLAARAIDTIVMLIIASAMASDMSITGALLIGAAITLGASIAVIPAHLGVFEASVIAGGALAGMAEEQAFAFALVFHAMVLAGWLAAAVYAAPELLRGFRRR
jgi:uncharacterized membrane protein YbhN (UPF0104 family)